MKINTATIPGFDEMSAEQKLVALLDMELPEADHTGYILKSVFDKKASEAAELSRKLKARLSDEEASKLAQEEAQSALQKQLEEASAQIAALTREKTVSGLTADYIAQGYSKELAAEAAAALADGDTAKVMAIGSRHLEAYAQTIKADLLKTTPTPPGASGSGNPEPANITAAKAAGQAKAASVGATNSGLAHYIK